MGSNILHHQRQMEEGLGVGDSFIFSIARPLEPWITEPHQINRKEQHILIGYAFSYG